jgi:hypothetical protein
VRGLGTTSSRPGSLHPMHASPVSVSLIHRSHSRLPWSKPPLRRSAEPAETSWLAVTLPASRRRGRQRHLIQPGRGKPTRLPPPDLAPRWLRGSTATWLPPDQVWRAAASRAGSRRLPPGGQAGTARIAVDRSPDRPLAVCSRYIGEAPSSSNGRLPHQRQHRIMDGGHSIRDCASCRSTGLHSAGYRVPPGGAPPAGRAGPQRLLAQTPSRSATGIPPTRP